MQEEIAVRVRVPVMAVAILALAALGGCGGGGAGNPTAAPTSGTAAITCNASGTGVAATIANLTFSPNPVTVAAGGMVTWTNNDSPSHTVSFDNGPDCGTLAPGTSQTVLFSVAGTYAYHCNIHRTMTGSVTVS
jgi:plastocyanin